MGLDICEFGQNRIRIVIFIILFLDKVYFVALTSLLCRIFYFSEVSIKGFYWSNPGSSEATFLVNKTGFIILKVLTLEQ